MLKKVAEFYKALGDETRLAVLEMLTDRELCVCEIIDQLNMSQPAVSHHLKILKRAGLVKDSREGKWIYYSLNNEVFGEVFTEEQGALVEHYAGLLKEKIGRAQPSRIRMEPSLCEKLKGKSK